MDSEVLDYIDDDDVQAGPSNKGATDTKDAGGPSLGAILLGMSQTLERLDKRMGEANIVEQPKKRKVTQEALDAGADDDVEMADDDDAEALLAGSSDDDHPAEYNEESEDDDPFSSIADEVVETEKCGPELGATLAKIINKRFWEPTALDLIKEKQANYAKPKNCEALTVPQVNPELRRKLSKELKNQDKGLGFCQKDLVKGSIAVAQATQEISKLISKDKREPIIRKLTDALALFGHSNYSLSMRRRELIKPGLKAKYAGLTSETVPLTKNLFGDEIEKTLKKRRPP
ncbi:uncharacterized protein LOC135500983 [Lineus longissimus]|uniref:uncharacterized protein LOC135500983 n=1 Tax=Lineus longissimus TaxID=88925 RepID=UPI00315C8C62